MFVIAGWVTILSEWLRSTDLALSLLAAKILANMDSEGTRHRTVYSDSVHIYHPKFFAEGQVFRCFF